MKLFLILYLIFAYQAVYACYEVFEKTDQVFVAYAQKHYGENWQKNMPVFWIEAVVNTTYHWKPETAREFLSFLEDRIGVENTIERLKYPYYFKDLYYKAFLERIKLYEKYIGTKGVNDRLKISLRGFEQGNVDKIEQVIKFVQSYIGEKRLKERMKRSLRVFSETNLEELKAVVQFIENYIGKQETQQIMQKDLRAFSNVNLEELKKVIEFVEGYIGKQKVIEKMRQGLRAFSNVSLEKLKQLEREWGEQKMKERLERYSLRNEMFYKF